jgi:hypothetical protein
LKPVAKAGAKVASSGTATFRLDNELLDWLREESGQKRTSLNTLVTQVLQSHVEYHTFASKAGMISMPKALIVTLIEKLDRQELIKLSEHIAKNDLKDAIILMKGRYTPEMVLEFIDAWARVAGFAYRHHVEEESEGSKKRHSIVLQHEMGERWSLYFIELLMFVFKEFDIKIDFQHTANTISMDVKV